MFFFKILDTNHVDVLFSQGYKSSSNMKKGLASVRLNLSDPLKYVIMRDHFILRAGNHREIGRSPIMKPDQLKEAMALLIKYGADAPIESDDFNT